VGKIVYKELPSAVCGYYDNETGCTYVDPAMSKQSQRNTITHEMFHKILGHGREPSAARRMAREVVVERLTARHLIPYPALLHVMCTYATARERADALGVGQTILYARIMGLEPEEQLFLDVCAMRCIGYKLCPKTLVDGVNTSRLTPHKVA
jgi:Zn-dependent peptidase ImmA (M78 family)